MGKCFLLMTHFCKSAFVWWHQRKVAKSSTGVVYVVAEKLIWFAVSFHLQTRGWRGCIVCPHISSLRLGNWPSSGPHRVIRHLIIPLLEARGSEAPWEERRGGERKGGLILRLDRAGSHLLLWSVLLCLIKPSRSAGKQHPITWEEQHCSQRSQLFFQPSKESNLQ